MWPHSTLEEAEAREPPHSPEVLPCGREGSQSRPGERIGVQVLSWEGIPGSSGRWGAVRWGEEGS